MTFDFTNDEAKYLLSTIDSVLNEKELTKSNLSVVVNYTTIYRLSNLHRVSNMLHYAIMGSKQPISNEVKKGFYASYHEALLSYDRNKNAEAELLWLFENKGIPCVLLKSFSIADDYPLKEMASSDSIMLLVREKDFKEIDEMLCGVDYSRSHLGDGFDNIYTRTPHCSIHILLDSAFGDIHIRRFLTNDRNLINYSIDFQCVKIYSVNDYYIFSMCYMVQQYAFKKLTIRAMLDFWVFFLKNAEALDWDYISPILDRLAVRELAYDLLRLSMVFFDSQAIEQGELERFDALQAYILSFGDISSPLATDYEIIARLHSIVNNSEEKERKEMEHQYLYPDREYMELLYPRLAKGFIGLRLAWLLRLIRIKLDANKKPKENKAEEIPEIIEESSGFEELADEYEPENNIPEDFEEEFQNKITPIMVSKDVRVINEVLDSKDKNSVDTEKVGAGHGFLSEDHIIGEFVDKQKKEKLKKTKTTKKKTRSKA